MTKLKHKLRQVQN